LRSKPPAADAAIVALDRQLISLVILSTAQEFFPTSQGISPFLR
jgi:hypothetical protein